MATFITETAEMREIGLRIRELNALAMSTTSYENRKYYNGLISDLRKQLYELRESRRSRSFTNNSTKVQNSVEFARANNVSEDRIFHNNHELKKWFRG